MTEESGSDHAVENPGRIAHIAQPAILFQVFEKLNIGIPIGDTVRQRVPIPGSCIVESRQVVLLRTHWVEGLRRVRVALKAAWILALVRSYGYLPGLQKGNVG